MILKSGKEWQPRHADILSWELAYSHIDVAQELLKMGVWLHANPGRRKTERGMNRFVVSWLGRAGLRGEKRSTRDTTLEQDLNDRSWAK